MKKYFIISLLLCLNVMLLVKLYSLKGNLTKSEFLLQKKASNYKLALELMMNRERLIYLNHKECFVGDNYLYNETGSKINFRTLSKSRPVLVFRYTELSCNACVDVEMFNLTKYWNVKTNIHPIIMTSYEDKSNLYMFKRVNRVEFEMYNTLNSKLPIDVEEDNIPYYFVLYPNGKVDNVFIPDKTLPQFTDQYFKIIEKIVSV